MKLDHEVVSGADLIRVEGRLDASTAPEFERGIRAVLAAEGARTGAVVADLSGVPYISSAGLRSLLILLKECSAQGRGFSIAAPSADVSDVIRLTGFDKVLAIHDDAETALAAKV